MNLAEMLGYADIGQLTRIAEVYRCECNSHSKNELIQSILRAISNKEGFKNQIHSMTWEEKRFLNSLLFDSQNAFSLEELIARVQQSRFDTEQQAPKSVQDEEKRGKATVKKSRKSKQAGIRQEPASPRDLVVKFKQTGWLFNGLTGPGRYLFHVPGDLKERFGEELGRQLRSSLHYVDEPEGFRDEQGLAADDLLTLLQFTGKHEIALNAEGAMYKRMLQQLLDSLHIREEIPARGAWRFGYGRRIKDYPNRLSLLYDYAYYNGLLIEDEAVLKLTAKGQQWVADRRMEEPTLLYKFWLRLYKGAVPNLLSLASWIDKLGDRWVTVHSLEAVLEPFIKPYYYDTPQSIIEQRIIRMMMHVGLLRIGEKQGTGQVLRMTKIGHAVVAGVYVAGDDKIELE
ncbi:hypothetical protein ACFOQM_20195 [Paenibacillus sp. GCM10012307]|uniref:Helicase XPB/Ssl2 N-terminal domain-containing protein n=1 Tax=Paenibacillus roseus TaxID=2798579 RepID=A0A934MS47_9BACL|nr:hypothetical protein [Paenibacillus roseus]MBJ6363548.1 hypothetical protein [Paenibacillus roseus]